MDDLFRDVRYALRMLGRSKAYSAVVVLTLGLAIGANSTLYSLVNAVVSFGDVFSEPETLAFLYASNPGVKRVRARVSYPDYLDFREQTTVFSDLAAMSGQRFALTSSEGPVRVRGNRVTANFLPLAGIHPVLGRVFRPDEDRPGAEPVAILGHGCWTRRFGASPDVLGQAIVLDGRAYQVVGVLSPATEKGDMRDVEVWVPLASDSSRILRDDRSLAVAARLKPGATWKQANVEVEAIAQRLAAQYPSTNSGWSAYVVPFSELVVGGNGHLFFALLVMTVGAVLLIACLNVANLLVARLSTRSREFAVRTALGAGRLPLVRQILIESAILSLLGGGMGLLLTGATLDLLVALTREKMEWLMDVQVDARVLLFTLGLALLTPILVALFPALRLSRAPLSEELKEAGRSTASRSRQRWRQALVASEVFLAVMLLVVAALFVRSLEAIVRIPLGFDERQVLTLRIELPADGYAEAGKQRRFFDQVIERVEALPPVQVAGLTSVRPIGGRGPIQAFLISGRSFSSPDEAPTAASVTVSPGFFATLRIPLLGGRYFSDQDSEESLPAAILSRAAAERYWAGRNPLGERIRVASSGESPWMEVVGVIGDLRNPDADQPPEPHVYLPFAQNPQAGMAVVLRTSSDPLAVLDRLGRRSGNWIPTSPSMTSSPWSRSVTTITPGIWPPPA